MSAVVKKISEGVRKLSDGVRKVANGVKKVSDGVRKKRIHFGQCYGLLAERKKEM